MARCALSTAQLLFFTATFVFGVGRSHADDVDTLISTDPDHTYGDLFEVRDVLVNDNDRAFRGRTYRRRLPMGRELAFTAAGSEFDFKVHLNLDLTEVWGHKANVLGALANGVDLTDRSYRGYGQMKKCTKDGDCEHYGEVGRASVTFFESFGEHVFHALLRLENEEFSVDPKRLVHKEKYLNGNKFPATDSPLSELEADMYFWSSSDVFEKEIDEQTGLTSFTLKRKLLQSYEVYTNCYDGQGQATYRISMGMLIDDGFYAVTGGNSQAVRDYVAGMFNDMNTMYSNQMGVEIGLQTLVLGDTTGFTKSTFNEGPTSPGSKSCPSGKQPSTRLNELRAWRQQYQPTNLGLWHLMTHCHPPSGTVGIAYVGALCHSFGAGLSNYLGSGTWTVLAHEVGHNFGAGHTFNMGASGGIMDYGDGTLNGIYQFHPVHKSEVCAEIQSSMRGNRQVSACWSAVNTPSGNPTPPPSPPPTNPTPQPTAPTPRPTVVIPTPRPTATPRPTLQPTVKPIVAGGSLYAWRDTGAFGACSVSCGNGFRTEVVECREYDLSTCSFNINNIDTSTCPTDNERSNFYSLCSPSTKVADALCMRGCKPAPDTQTCNAGNCGGNQCGNGILDKNEYCDTALETCCQSCTGWKTTTACQATNPVVDAAVMDYDQRLYTFQGDKFAIYDDMDDINALDVYPLTTIQGLDASFQNGVDSAASFYDDIIFLFKGLNWVVVDLGEMAQLGDLRDVDDYFTLNDDFKNCGQIDAVLSYYWTLDLVCDDITAEYSWVTDAVGPSKLVTDEWTAMNFPAEIAPGQTTAAVRNPADGTLRFYKGSYYTEWREGATGTAQPKRSPAFGTELAKCAVEHCETCAGDGLTCNTCETGYRRKNRGRRCKPGRNFVDLTFDDSDYTSALMQFTSGHESGSADNGGWGYAGEIVDGAFGSYGLHLNGDQEFRLQSFDFGGVTSEWKLSFLWKPENLRRERLLTINRDRYGYNELFTIDFTHESETEPVGADRFAIEVHMYDTRIDCYVENAIVLNEWNKVTVEFGLGYVTTSANGMRHTMSMEAGTADYAVEFKDWKIGEANSAINGISGTIDKFEVANLQPEQVARAEGGKPTWLVAVLVSGGVLAFMLAAGIMYKCVIREKFCAPELNEHLNTTTAPSTTTGFGTKLPRAPTPDDLEKEVTPVAPVRPIGGVQAGPNVRALAGMIRAGPHNARNGSGRRGAPGKKRAPPPPARGSNRGKLDLGLSPEARRESWRID